jgi:hypothetical protein
MSKLQLVVFFIVGLLGLVMPSLHAQSSATICKKHACVCGSSDPTPASVMISHVHNKNEWMLSYKYMNMGMNGILSGTQTVDKSSVFVNYLMSPDKMRMDMHMVMAMYGVTNRLTLMAMFNYNTMAMDMTMFTKSGHIHAGAAVGDTSGTHFMRTSGIGDVKLNALYGLINSPNQQLVLSAGISLPIGTNNVKGATEDAMYPNKNYPYAMQMGSGTFDILPCVNYLFQKNNVTFSTQIAAIIRTSNNAMGYKLGNEATLNSWVAYQLLPFLNSSIRLEGNISNKISGYDSTLYAYNELSANTLNYGGKRINAAIGSVFQFKNGALKNHRLAIEYAVPIYQNLNGVQMAFNHQLTAAWSMAYGIKN